MQVFFELEKEMTEGDYEKSLTAVESGTGRSVISTFLLCYNGDALIIRRPPVWSRAARVCSFIVRIAVSNLTRVA